MTRAMIDTLASIVILKRGIQWNLQLAVIGVDAEIFSQKYRFEAGGLHLSL